MNKLEELEEMEILEEWIHENPWIKKSDKYINKEYDSHFPMININELSVSEKVLNEIVIFIDTWILHKPYPIEFYIHFLSIDRKIYNKGHIYDMVNGDKRNIIKEANNLELLIFAVENNIITNIDNCLIYMSILGNLNFVIYLVNIGANIDKLKNYLIQWCPSIEIMKYLISKGADIHIGDDSPLLSACKNGKIEFVKILVNEGANIYINKNGKNVFITAAYENNHIEVVEYLKSKGLKL